MNIPLTHRAGIQVILHRVDYDLDITSRVLSGSIDTGDVSSVGTGSLGSDAVVSTLTLTLDGGEPFLSPTAGGIFNSPRPLLRPYRRVTVWAGVAGEEAYILFAGYLGDSVRVETSSKSRRITLTARDIAKPFQDSYRRTFPVLASGGNKTVASVLQQLINLIPASMRPDLLVPVAPAFLVASAYQPEKDTVWNVMQTLVTGMGWYLGARGRDLILLDPPRGEHVADIELDFDDVFVDALDISDTDVRNRVTITYSSGGASITRSDQSSINNVTDGVVKESYFQFSPETPVNTLASAEALADRFLHDMSLPHGMSRLTLPFLPEVRVFTTLGLNNPLISAESRLAAVVSVRHNFNSAGVARTVVLGSERVLGGHDNWLRREAKPGGEEGA